MHTSLVVSVVVMIVGLVVYLMVPPDRPSNVGRIMFAMGLLVSLLHFNGVLTLR